MRPWTRCWARASCWGAAGDLPTRPYDRTFLVRTDGSFVADVVINEEAEPTLWALGP